MNSGEFYRLIQIPDPVRVQYEKWDAAGASRMDPDLESRLLRRDQWDDAWKELTDRLGPSDADHVRALWEELSIALRQVPRWKQAGIPREVFRDTMMFASRYLKDGLAAYGHYCFTAGWWFPRQLAMELFRLGSLEFELLDGAEGRRVSLHIPTDASLDSEAVDDSLQRFRAFAARFFPGWTDAPMYCDSWLISPAIRPLLAEGSRIRAFQDRFEVLSADSESMGAVGWVFPGHSKDPETFGDLPEGSSLQKKMKAFLLGGGKPGWAEGRMK